MHAAKVFADKKLYCDQITLASYSFHLNYNIRKDINLIISLDIGRENDGRNRN